MRIAVLVLAGLLAQAAVAQESKREVWVWTDANGVTQYSDRPVAGARKLQLSTYTPEVVAAPAAPSTASANSTPDAAPVKYQRLEIWQPANGESFFGADATVNVRMRSEPALASADSLWLYLDGKVIEGAPNSLEYTLSNLERGAHTLSAVIADEKGKEKIRSEPRVFHIRQPTVVQPQAVGPNLKPKQPRTR